MNLSAMQKAIRASNVDGWLFCDFRVRDLLAYEALGLDPTGHFTRRWFVFVPRSGQPRRMLNAIEAGLLDTLPGTKTTLPQPRNHGRGVAQIDERRAD